MKPIENPYRLNAKKCYLWTKILNETQFCVRLSKKNLESNHFDTLESFLDHVEFCDFDEPIDSESNSIETFRYRMSIVLYSLYDQMECDQSYEIIVGVNNQIVYRQNLFENFERILSEQCDCPLQDWYERMRCDSISNRLLQQQIHRDLKSFGTEPIDFQFVLDEARKLFANFTRTYAFCHYRIENNRVNYFRLFYFIFSQIFYLFSHFIFLQPFKHCYGEYVGFSKFFDEILLSLLRKTTIPDVDLLVNLGDWPLSIHRHLNRLPIFSWCGSSDTYDIVLPTYELSESILQHINQSPMQILNVFGHQTIKFDEKNNSLFWRGRDSNRARLRLIELAKLNPDRYDVAITNFFFFRDEMHRYRSSRENQTYVSFLNFFNHRYQINLDGTVAAYRFPFLLAGTSLILKQRSKYFEFFYDRFVKDQHYLEIKEDLSDLDDTLQQLIDGKISLLHIKRMIWNSRITVLKHLLPSSIYCYYFEALRSYSKRLKRNEDFDNQRSLNEDFRKRNNLEPIQHQSQSKQCDCLSALENRNIRSIPFSDAEHRVEL